MHDGIKNPFWDEVSDRIIEDPYNGGPVIGDHWDLVNRGFSVEDSMIVRRGKLAGQYSWGVSDPQTLAFILEHCGSRVIDPLAGTGYWAWLLAQAGRHVIASDAIPPPGNGKPNHWHSNGECFVPVTEADAVDALAGIDATLLLMWPPYGEAVGARIVSAYEGDSIIYYGEGEGGCCADDAMFQLFTNEWVAGADHRPIQWSGMHDYVTVYHRATEGNTNGPAED